MITFEVNSQKCSVHSAPAHVTVNEIPTMGVKLVPYVVDEACWPIQIDRLFPTDQHP